MFSALANTYTASSAYAGIATSCVGSNVCYSLNIPDATVSSGTGDIFMQISGPTTYSWLGLGQGSSMSGANFFIVYASSGGTNVTLSPRSAAGGHNMPTYNSAAQVTLLEGSGIKDGVMTANIKCKLTSPTHTPRRLEKVEVQHNEKKNT